MASRGKKRTPADIEATQRSWRKKNTAGLRKGAEVRRKIKSVKKK